MAKRWRYITGRKGVNRIRVYERNPGGPIFIEWYDRNGRHQKTLTKTAGIPLYADSEENRKLATEIAERAAAAQRKKREAQAAHQLLGLPTPRTLGELLGEYEKAHPEWSPGHARDQVVNKRYWEDRLGADRLLNTITPARAADVVRNDAYKLTSGFGKRTQRKRLQYLKDAYTYARKKLKWITEQEDMSALDTPDAGGESKPYTLDEARRLLLATERVDKRCTAAAYVAWISGRRLDAIRTLEASAYSVEQHDGDAVGVLQFPGATDKARRSGRVYLTGRAKEVVEALLNTPAVRTTGYLFPSGDLDRLHPPRVRVSDGVLREWLREAEALAEVESVPGRAYHGLKRRYATEALRHDPTAASKQSGTTVEMLRRVYEQDDPAAKVALARHLEKTVNGGGG